MTPDEIKHASEEGKLGPFEAIDPQTATTIDGNLTVSQYVAIPVYDVSSLVDSSSDIEILDEAGVALGTLCLVRGLGSINIASFTTWRFAAFLADAKAEHIGYETYSFEKNYIVLDPGRYAAYKMNYAASAPIWGRYSHSPPPAPVAPTLIHTVSAQAGLKLPTSHHEEALRRYVSASNDLDRYLKLYHCIELLFDFIVFARIKALGDDLLGFPHLLTEHGRTEQERLRSIIREFCGSPAKIATKFPAIASFPAERDDIFYKFGKSSNPLPKSDQWAALKGVLDSGKSDLASWRLAKIVHNQSQFDDLVCDLASYWVYRVRSSIAHNRVGEYLLQDVNAPFVAAFAEPLLHEVVGQIFSSQKLHALI